MNDRSNKWKRFTRCAAFAGAAGVLLLAACGGAQQGGSQTQSKANEAAPATAENRPETTSAGASGAAAPAERAEAENKSETAGNGSPSHGSGRKNVNTEGTSRTDGAAGARSASGRGHDSAASENPEERMPKPAPEPRYTIVRIPEGKRLPVSLNAALSSKTSKVGDTFTATLGKDVRDKADGTIGIPNGSILTGEVIEVRTAKALKGQAMISIKMISVRLASGKDLPIVASLVTEGKDTTKRTVGGIAGGAAAGAILGRVLGKDTKGAVIGAVAGAAIGTGVVLGMDNKDVLLPEGTDLMLNLDEVLEVPVPSTQS